MILFRLFYGLLTKFNLDSVTSNMPMRLMLLKHMRLRRTRRSTVARSTSTMPVLVSRTTNREITSRIAPRLALVHSGTRPAPRARRCLSATFRSVPTRTLFGTYSQRRVRSLVSACLLIPSRVAPRVLVTCSFRLWTRRAKHSMSSTVPS